MGCNESKSSSVATDNTTRRTPLRKKSTKRTNTINNNNNNPLESIPETDTNVVVNGPSPTSVKGQEFDNPEKASSAGVHADVKEVVVNNNAEEEEGVVVEGTTTTVGKKAGKLVLKESPERYFSSRKDEDGVEPVVTEEGYYSPNHESVKDVETREERGEPEELEPELAVKEEEKLQGGLVEEKRTEVATEEKLAVYQVVEPDVIFKEALETLPSIEPNEDTKIEDKEAVVVTEAPYNSLQAKEQDAE